MILNSILPTKIELNGPILSFSNGIAYQPTSVFQCKGTTATFTGLATAIFPTQSPSNPAENSGYISYQWYEVGIGSLSDVGSVSGTKTRTLSISNLRTPADHNRKFYLKADYVNSAYSLPVGSAVTVGTAKSTGNALNDGLESNVVTLGVYPDLKVVKNPAGQTVSQSKTASFSVEGSLTDSSQGNLSYPWQSNGRNLSDGSLSTNNSYTTFNNTYTSDTTVIIPSDAYGIKIIIAGSAGSIPGAGRYGAFTLPDGGRTLKLTVNTSSTGKGGSGGSPGGGSGGSASAIFDVGSNSWIIIAGGGAGGVGSVPAPCSGNPITAAYRSVTPVYAGSNASAWSTSIGTLVSGNNGSNGGITFISCPAGDEENYQNAGSGGGGGGSSISGESAYNSSIATLLANTSALNNLTGYITISYNTPGSSLGGSTEQVINTTTISGSTTPNLKISSTIVGSNLLNCVLSHPTACNSPIYTDAARYTVVSARQIVNVEVINQNAGTLVSTASYNLFDIPSVTFDGSNVSGLICLYASEKPVNVIMECYAGKGYDNGGYPGGAGGVSKIQFTMPIGEEFIINNIPQSNNSGAVFIYYKQRLLVAVGAGGNAGGDGAGGAGGGVNVSGESGFGRGGGSGGLLYRAGTLPFPGIFGSTLAGQYLYDDDSIASSPYGGRILPCPRGDFWRGRGYSPCQELGNVPFYNQNGTLVSGTSSILRGFKAGYGIRNTAGRGINGGGTGGNGATGGNGGDGGGGGGGSGYTDGTVTILSTSLGGNTAQPRVVLRLGDLL